MTKNTSSRSGRVRVPNNRNKRRREAEAYALQRPWFPEQGKHGLHIRYGGLVFTNFVVGPLWVTAHMDPSWGLGTRVSVLRLPVPKEYVHDGYNHMEYTIRIPPELHEVAGDPRFLITNPVSEAKMKFDSFPSRKYHEGREVAFIEVTEAHEKSCNAGFLPIHVRGKEVARFRVEVKTEDIQTGTITVRYHVKSRI